LNVDLPFFLERYAPVTTGMAFVHQPIAKFWEKFQIRLEDLRKIWESPVGDYQVEKVNGGLVDFLEKIGPIKVPISKYGIISAGPEWTAWFDASPCPDRGQATYNAMIQEREVVVSVQSPHDPNGHPGSIGSTQFAHIDYQRSDRRVRQVIAHFESRWEFQTIGEPFLFEDLEAYKRKKIRDRLTPEMVAEYCRHFGLHIFDPNFYTGPGYIVTPYQPPNTKTTAYPIASNTSTVGRLTSGQ
jgi:hypothetical protein